MKISGYASLFLKKDLSGDIVDADAFNSCLKRRMPKQIKMLYHHDVTQPIGCWRKVYSTSKGLWVEGDIVVQSRQGKDVAALVEAGALDGLSIGFRVIKAVKRSSQLRFIKEIDLLEISLVTFPMQPAARLVSKGRIINDIEFLTDRIRSNTMSHNIM